MKITYYGHSCFSVIVAEKALLFDPYISGNPLASAVNIEAIPADYIFASHAHFDHITDLLRIAGNTNAKAIGGWELYNYFNANGLTNTHPINPGGKYSFDFGTVKCFNAVHSSSFADGSYGGTAAGFAFDTPEGNFYYSGDTALHFDMRLVPEWNKMDFAVLPIGDGLTMGVEDAIKACAFIGVEKVLGVHYDTFGFIKIDHRKAVKAFSNAGIKLFLPQIGQTIDI